MNIPKLPPRPHDAHKGNFGRILIVGGSTGMIGAPALAANGALRAGAGLVTIATPATIQPTVASLAWCATSIALPYERETGCISPQAIPDLLNAIIAEKRFDVVALGPGLGRAVAVNELTKELVRAEVPMVIDADGLNILSEINWYGMLLGRCVITPHPGELARLMGRSTNQIQSDRHQAAHDAVELMTGGKPDCRAVCVLKGAGTIVTDGKQVYVNETGNPGMASGGSGDVLTGMIAALVGQGLSCFDAAVLGVYLHGLAGDLAAEQLGQTSLIAEDLLRYLPAAFKQLEM